MYIKTLPQNYNRHCHGCFLHCQVNCPLPITKGRRGTLAYSSRILSPFCSTIQWDYLNKEELLTSWKSQHREKRKEMERKTLLGHAPSDSFPLQIPVLRRNSSIISTWSIPHFKVPSMSEEVFKIHINCNGYACFVHS